MYLKNMSTSQAQYSLRSQQSNNSILNRHQHQRKRQLQRLHQHQPQPKRQLQHRAPFTLTALQHVQLALPHCTEEIQAIAPSWTATVTE